MKTKQTKSTLYSPPVAEELVVRAEGILCVSVESYKDCDANDGFKWEED